MSKTQSKAKVTKAKPGKVDPRFNKGRKRGGNIPQPAPTKPSTSAKES